MSKAARRNRLILRLFLILCCTGLVMVPIALKPKPALSAEKLYIIYGPLKLSLSVNSLQTFAETGKVDSELRFYARFVGAKGMVQLRKLLQLHGDLSLTTTSQLTYAPISEDFLQRLGQLVKTEAGVNGFHAIRAAWILSAHKSQSYTLIDLLRNYPTKRVLINFTDLQTVQQILLTLVDYKKAATTAIAQAAQAEAATEPKLAASQLPDPRKPGPFQVSRRTLQLERPVRSLEGNRVNRRFKVELYIPEGTSQPAPIVAISHGMGSTPTGFSYLGEHLASYGFVVAIPEHVGSGKAIKKALLAGLINTNVDPADFVERPLDIKQTLDELEQLTQSDPTLKGRFNLQNVGVIGHSFGGYTALALAGARLNMARVVQDCAINKPRINLSIYLQCLSSQLPATESNLSDPRIKAVISINPLTSIVFGPEEMSRIQVPTMLVSASHDFLTGAVSEQIHPFLWLKTQKKYLVSMVPAGHTAADQGERGKQNQPLTQRDILFAGPDPALTRDYIRALSLAFMQTYVAQHPEYQTYLSASYAQAISQKPIQVDLVRSLTPAQLEQAYGSPPPVPFFPAPVTGLVVNK
ncbi:alpha/beta hydrolase [Phormidesmis priestleyi]|nr:alpha/beta hydrolase [Phormidesmis priestleyi]